MDNNDKFTHFRDEFQAKRIDVVVVQTTSVKLFKTIFLLE